MQYKSGSKKVAPLTSPNIPVSQEISPANDPQIQWIRKVLIVHLGMYLANVCFVADDLNNCSVFILLEFYHNWPIYYIL